MINLLVVDDNTRDHDRYRKLMDGTGVGVVCCAGGAEALRLAHDEASNPGVVLILWELPGEPGGDALLVQLRRTHPTLPVIVVSELLDISRAATARALGAFDFLLKPVVPDRLRDAVRRAVGGHGRSPLLEPLHSRLVGESPAFEDMLEALAAVIPHRSETVLLIGENGTGKELLARAVHDLSGHPVPEPVSINVAVIPATLLETTLFGHEAGAFTGAHDRQIGVFEQCGNGTLFLDEIGELEIALQAKLLRVIQERQFRRVGGREDLKFAARIVCATNRDLITEVAAGRFRQDLYYRISRHEIRVPPLRERGGDLWLLLDHFVSEHDGGRDLSVAIETRELLAGYPFPGNVRELEDLIKQALLRCDGDLLLPFDLPVAIMNQRQEVSETTTDRDDFRWPKRFREMHQKEAMIEVERAFNREYLPRKLREAGGKKQRAAELAGLDPKTFGKKWKDCGLSNQPDAE